MEEKNNKEKKLGEIHFLSPIWIREKIQGKFLFSINFFSLVWRNIGKLIDYKCWNSEFRHINTRKEQKVILVYLLFLTNDLV